MAVPVSCLRGVANGAMMTTMMEVVLTQGPDDRSFSTTPVLTHHARQRCAEMKVRTRRVKRIVRDPSLVYPSLNGFIAMRHDDPTIAAIYVVDERGRQVVVTVVWRTQEQYTRPESVRR